MSAVRKQRGWVGLIVLLIALLIVGVLAQTLMRQMGLVSPDQDTTRTAGPRGPGPTSGVPDRSDRRNASAPQRDRTGEGTRKLVAAADAGHGPAHRRADQVA